MDPGQIRASVTRPKIKRFRPGWQYQLFQADTATESLAPDFRHGLGNVHLPQRTATVEHAVADFADSRRNGGFHDVRVGSREHVAGRRDGRQGHFRDGRAIGERGTNGYVGHASGNYNPFQACAIGKGIPFDVRHAVGNLDFRNAGTIGEGPVGDGGQPFPQHNLFHMQAIRKCALSDNLHSGGQVDAPQIGAPSTRPPPNRFRSWGNVNRPQTRAVPKSFVSDFRHRPRQNHLAQGRTPVEHPVPDFPSPRRNGGFHDVAASIGKSGPSNRAGRQRHLGDERTSREGTVPHVRHAGRNRHPHKIRTALEGIGIDLGHAFRDDQLGWQVGASVEGFLPDLQRLRLKHERRQVRAFPERCLLDALQRPGERDASKAFAAPKDVCGHDFHAFGNLQVFHLGVDGGDGIGVPTIQPPIGEMPSQFHGTPLRDLMDVNAFEIRASGKCPRRQKTNVVRQRDTGQV